MGKCTEEIPTKFSSRPPQGLVTIYLSSIILTTPNYSKGLVNIIEDKPLCIHCIFTLFYKICLILFTGILGRGEDEVVDFQQQFLALTPLTDVGVAHLSEQEKNDRLQI